MFTLESLGLSQEELQERVVAHIADLILSSKSYNDEGCEVEAASRFKKQIVEMVKKRTDEHIQAIAEKHILPGVATFIETLIMTETNKWGEKSGKTMTFIEYLAARAEAYMQEKVDYNGKTQAEETYNFRERSTRIVHLVNSHLATSIEKAMKDALSIALGSFAKGIHETARIKLNEIAAQMKVSVTV